MLTTAQLTTLKSEINADAALSSLPPNSDGAFAIAAAFNLDAVPDFIVWRTSVSIDEIMNNGFVWTAVDSMTVGKARIWDWMSRLGSINPSKTNIRQGLVDAFGAGSAMANGILPHLKRKATRAEKLFASGTGSDAQPATMAFEGAISFQDVEAARNLP